MRWRRHAYHTADAARYLFSPRRQQRRAAPIFIGQQLTVTRRFSCFSRRVSNASISVGRFMPPMPAAAPPTPAAAQQRV